MRDIRSLLAECPEEFSQSNFGLADYMDEQGKARPMYNVFFDGFILIVMGYTGPKALQLKLAYIAAFNAMRDRLAAMPENALPPAGMSQDEIVSELSTYKEQLCKGLTPDKRYKLGNAIGFRLKRNLGTRFFTEIRADQIEEAKRLMSVPIGGKVSTGPRKSCETPVENKMLSFKQQFVQAGYDDIDYSYTVRTDAAGAQQITHILQLTEAPV